MDEFESLLHDYLKARRRGYQKGSNFGIGH